MRREARVRWRMATLGLLTLGLAIVAAGAGTAPGQPADKTKKKAPEPASPALEQVLQKARAGGKYAMLLRQIKVDEDREIFGEFREAGVQRMRRYKGHNDVPAGYWVYADPYWYIWRDLTATPSPRRAWGPEQAIGKPDTQGWGDFGTAWASLTPDGQDEWLFLEFAEPVIPAAVRIHESWNPGAVSKISMFKLDGKEVEVWNGKDPTSVDEDFGVSEIKVEAPFKTNRLRLHLDSREVRGWNEIDAVALVDSAGKSQWAVAAEASSTSAGSNDQAVLQALMMGEQRVRLLEQEIKRLYETLEELKKASRKEK